MRQIGTFDPRRKVVVRHHGAAQGERVHCGRIELGEYGCAFTLARRIGRAERHRQRPAVFAAPAGHHAGLAENRDQRRIPLMP
jgi:hypothetical protein